MIKGHNRLAQVQDFDDRFDAQRNFDATEAARRAARRAGLSLNSWISQVVAEKAESLGLDEDDLDEDERMDAVIEKLTRPNVRTLRQPLRDVSQRAAAPRRAPSLGRVLERLDTMETRMERGQEPSNDAVLAQALQRIEQRIDALDKKSTPARAPRAAADFAAPKQSARPNDVFATLEAKLQALNASLDRNNAAYSAPAFEQPVPAFAQPQAPAFVPPAPAPVQPAQIDERVMREIFERDSRAFDGLHSEIAKLAEQMQDLRRPRPVEGLANLQQDIGRLAEQMQDLRRPQPVEGMANLQRDLGQIAQILSEMAPRQNNTALEYRLNDLIEVMSKNTGAPANTDGLRQSLLKPIHELADDLRQRMSEVDPRQNIAALEREIRQLSGKVSQMETGGFDHVAIGNLQNQTQDMRELLQQTLMSPRSFEALESQIAYLTDKIETMQSRPATQSSAHEVVAAIDEIRALVDRKMASPNIGALESHVQMLSSRIENAMAQSYMSREPQPAADTSHLEAMMHELAQKIDSAQRPQADSRAFAALEQQMTRISMQLERSDGQAHFKSLQNSITDLFGMLDETREVARHAAEATLRQAEANPGAAAQVPSPKVEALSQDMSMLLRSQEAADHRAQQTMTAVHATLEKIVGRLASLEEEVTVARQQPVQVVAAPVPPVAATPTVTFEAAPQLSVPLRAPTRPVERVEAPKVEVYDDEPPIVTPPRAQMKPYESEVSVPDFTASRVESVEASAGDDFLLEPGKGFAPPRRAGRTEEPKVAVAAAVAVSDAAPATKSDFIAAARRAAQAAAVAAHSQMESVKPAAAAAKAGKVVADVTQDTSPASLVEKARAFAEERKRPLLLGLAGVMVAFLGVQVFGTLIGGDSEGVAEKPAATQKIAPAKQVAPAKPVTEAKPVAEAKPVDVKPVDTKPAQAAPAAIPMQGAAVPLPSPAANPAPMNIQPQTPAPRPQAAPTNPLSRSPMTLPPMPLGVPKASLDARQPLVSMNNVPGATGGFNQNLPTQNTRGFAPMKSANAVNGKRIDLTPLGTMAPQPDVNAPIESDVPMPSPAAMAPKPVDVPPQAAQPSLQNPQSGLQKAPGAVPQPAVVAPPAAVDAPPAAPVPVKLPNPPVTAPLLTAPLPTALDPAYQPATPALKAAANAGVAAAEYELASKYADGRGEARDFKAAAALFEKAAAHGLVPAQYRLGALYEKGLGVPRDVNQAKTLYQRAADKGNPRAMHNLAVLTAEGADGHPDYANALIWFRKAAEYGVRDSQFNLAILSARGLGQNVDLAQAYTWFAIAAAQGDEDAGKKRDEVALRLDAMALENAKVGAAAFKAKTADPSVVDVVAPAGGWEANPPKAENKPAVTMIKPKLG